MSEKSSKRKKPAAPQGRLLDSISVSIRLKKGRKTDIEQYKLVNLMVLIKLPILPILLTLPTIPKLPTLPI